MENDDIFYSLFGLSLYNCRKKKFGTVTHTQRKMYIEHQDLAYGQFRCLK
jgi:hypothetical protein